MLEFSHLSICYMSSFIRDVSRGIQADIPNNLQPRSSSSTKSGLILKMFFHSSEGFHHFSGYNHGIR